MKKLMLNIITIICIIAIGISGYKIFTTLKDYKKADNVYSNIRETKEETNLRDLSKKMAEINSDYKCWINVDGTNIDYPVVQGSDNSFYLNHDFNKNYLSSGSSFMDYRNNFNNDLNTIIYGHHMRNSTMFAQIEKFKKEDFFNNNKFVTLSTEEGTYQYEIFAVGVFPADFGYTQINFADENDFDNYIQKIMGKSIFTRNKVSYNDHIITLSTCSYEFDDARTALFAKRVN